MAELGRLGNDLGAVHVESRFRQGDGGYRWLAWTCWSQPDTGFLHARVRDVSEARGAQERMDEIQRHILDLCAVFNYEIRSPLALILGTAEYLLDESTPDEEIQECVEHIFQGAERAQTEQNAFIHELRLFREVCENHEGCHSISIGTLLTDIEAHIESWCRDWHIDIAFEYRTTSDPSRPVSVGVSADRLHMALQRLLKVCALLPSLGTNAYGLQSAQHSYRLHHQRQRSPNQSGRVVLDVEPRDGTLAFRATAVGITPGPSTALPSFCPDIGLNELLRKLGAALHVEGQTEDGWSLWFELEQHLPEEAR